MRLAKPSQLGKLFSGLRRSDERHPAEPAGAALTAAAAQTLGDPADYRRLAESRIGDPATALTDFWFADDPSHCDPDAVIDRLRWGGQLIFASHTHRMVDEVAARFARRPEFIVERPGARVDESAWRGPGTRWRRRPSFFVARKVLLGRPGEVDERYSYDVRLAPSETPGHHFVVRKCVPSYEHALGRLQRMFPETRQELAEKGARKLVQKVFPVFLTREAAFLKLLQRDLPEPYRDRVPKLLEMRKDERGLVRQIDISWLRLGGRRLSQLEFARQSAELLHILHQHVHVMHLDLRLDNFVVSDAGVGFVDFGSAVRFDEDFSSNEMLMKLFREMLSSSVIHRDLKRLQSEGKVTSSLFRHCYQRIDRATDLFYLALQMSKPHWNPDFRGLVDYCPDDPPAVALSRLRKEVLRPTDPERPVFRCAHDLWRAIERIEQSLDS